MADILQRIAEQDLCHGCGACVAALPSGRAVMVMTPAGYLRPKAQQPLSAFDESRVTAVCSGITIGHDAIAPDHDVLWGPLRSVHTGYATDEQVRYAGSSGGVLSALALFLVQSGRAAFVLQVRNDEADPFGNRVAESRSRDDVLVSAGSRYVPSATLAELEWHLASGAQFAVVGKPCDIASLRRMAKTDARIARQIPVMLSFFCAGIPSRNDALALARAMGADPDDVEGLVFRGDGWPGYARASLRDGRQLRMDYNTSWGTILNRHLQFRCKICPDGTGEFADVVCGDAWYSKDGYPDFAERPGRSLVLGRSAVGEALLGAAAAAGAVVLEPLSATEIAGMQPYQTIRKQTVLARLAGMALAGRRIPHYRRMRLAAAARRAPHLLLLRNIAGAFLRALGRRSAHA